MRLVQNFSAVQLAPEAAPPGSLWKKRPNGRNRESVEECWPMSAITLFVKVCRVRHRMGRVMMIKKGGLWVRFAEA